MKSMTGDANVIGHFMRFKERCISSDLLMGFVMLQIEDMLTHWDNKIKKAAENERK